MMITTIAAAAAAAAISLVVGYAVSLFLWFCSMSLVAESLFADATYINGKHDDVGNSSRSDADQEIKAKDHKNDELLTD